MSNEISKIKTDHTQPCQLGLFALVDSVEEANSIVRYSNAIGSLDVIPRFCRGHNQPIPISEAPKNTEIQNRYHVNNTELSCNIKPAQITRKVDGVPTTFLAYPGDREELIERTLFLIASNGKMQKKSLPGVAPRHGVHFSLYEIREHLKAIGKSKPYDEIREALLVLRDSVTTISQKDEALGKEIEVTNKIFADSVLESSGTGRGRDKCFITFSDYVIDQILDLNFRQYSFDSVNTHKKTVGTFIHSYLCWNWLNVAAGSNFTIDPEEIMTAYGKRNISKERKRRDVREGLASLVKHGLITHVPRIKDDKYVITATRVLYNEILRANKKKRGIFKIKTSLENGGIKDIPSNRVYHLPNIN